MGYHGTILLKLYMVVNNSTVVDIVLKSVSNRIF